MSRVYITESQDVSPDGMRADVQPILFVQSNPPRGNADRYPVIENGWLGNTNNTYHASHGGYDLDIPSERAEFMRRLRELARNYGAVVPSLQQIRASVSAHGVRKLLPRGTTTLVRRRIVRDIQEGGLDSLWSKLDAMVEDETRFYAEHPDQPICP